MRFGRWLRRLRRGGPKTMTSLEAYRLWAEAYPPAPHNRLMEVEQAAMLRLMPSLKGKLVLDLASGTGRYGLVAWKHQARGALALDNSPDMLARNPLTRRVLASAERLPLRGASFDVVVCALALGHLPDLKDALHEIARVLKPGGAALISDLHPLMFYRGAQRTFTTAAGTFAVEHYNHLFSDYHSAACSAGLVLDAVAEPSLEERDNLPVVIVYRFVRPGSVI
ncbi:MAG: methyltransferase domain-containing protein [Chloroflexota bacterium]